MRSQAACLRIHTRVPTARLRLLRSSQRCARAIGCVAEAFFQSVLSVQTLSFTLRKIQK